MHSIKSKISVIKGHCFSMPPLFWEWIQSNVDDLTPLRASRERPHGGWYFTYWKKDHGLVEFYSGETNPVMALIQAWEEYSQG